MVTPEDREKYKHYSDKTILAIKLIGGLTNDAIRLALKQIDARKIYYTVVEQVRLLLQAGNENCLFNFYWVATRIVEEARDREMITNDEFERLLNKIM